MHHIAPPEDPIQLYKYDHIDERGTWRYYVGFARCLWNNPKFLDEWKLWQRLKQFELLAILAAIVGLVLQALATNEAREQFTEEMRFNREQWEEQRITNSWALVAAAANPEDVGNIGARYALETLNGKGESLGDVRLPRSNLRGANLEGAFLSEANLEGARLWDANLEGAHLWGANLEGAHLWGANLEGAYLQVANLKGADLQEANLKGVELLEANLEGANLRGANLKRADLRAANLERAALERANLEGARLRGANLEGARLSIANLEGVTYLDCDQLKTANGWESSYRDEACGAPIPEKPADYRWNDAGE